MSDETEPAGSMDAIVALEADDTGTTVVGAIGDASGP